MAEEMTTQAPATTTNDGSVSTSEPINLLADDVGSVQDANAAPAKETATIKAADPELAPEKYEFKAPEGKEFDPEFIKEFEVTARELNLTQDKAQKMLERVTALNEQRVTAQIEKVRNDWVEQSKQNKEWGGAKLKESLSIAKTGLDTYATPELKKLINDSGFGNHPEVINLFYKLGKSVNPDSFVTGSAPENNNTQPKSMSQRAAKMYPTLNP